MNTFNLKEELLNRDGKVSKVKVPVTRTIKDGDEVREEQSFEEKAVTLGAMLEHACLKQGQHEPDEVLERFELFLKLKDKDKVELTLLEVEKLSQLVAEAFDTYMAGTILTILTK